MGITKTEEFTDQQNKLAVIAKAIGHPARIAILQFLSSSPSCICGNIVDVLPLAQPTVSQHLKELKNAGLIKGTIEGRAICYCIDNEGLRMIQDFFGALLTNATNTNKCC